MVVAGGLPGVVLLDSAGDHAPLVSGEGAGYDIRNGAARPLLPQLSDGVLGVIPATQETKL